VVRIWASYAVTVCFIVGLTNAFKLIDGIDSLAGGLGGINCITLGILLLWLNDFNYALIAFLRYNFAAYPKKILMGDAGSLLLIFNVLFFKNEPFLTLTILTIFLGTLIRLYAK
jgi:UDP-GlcNAc:undecaprenyl-phosphate GlcNAc-1-phosphate transferase